jgi:hypothetical protein
MGTTILALLGAFLLLLLSSLAKEYIPTACCLLALLFAASSVATLRREIEKSKDECRGQRSINRACDQRHKEAVDKLEQEKLDLAVEKPCIRVHYEQRDAIARGHGQAAERHQRPFDSAGLAAAEARCPMAGERG